MLCVMFPVSIWLIIWWIPTVSQLFVPNKCKCESYTKSDGIPKEIQRIIMMALVIGIKKFLEHRQKNKDKQ